MLVHYLEWSSTQVSTSSTYNPMPSETSTVNVVNDQSSYAPNEWPDLTETIGSTTRIIPGSFLYDYMVNIQDTYDQYSTDLPSSN